MATQPTQLPVASETPRDLKFNAGKIDEFVTSFAQQYLDRFGNRHYTIEGLKQLVLQQIYNLGWSLAGSFQGGGTVTSAGDLLQDESTNIWYRWDDLETLPKTVPPGSTPASAGGTGQGKWQPVDVADVLRKDLARTDGASLIGSGNYSDIRSYSGSRHKIQCYGRSAIGDGGDGVFVRDDADATTADNGGTVLIDAAGRRWKRVFNGEVLLLWFCERGDGVSDYTTPLRAASQLAVDNDLDLVIEAGVYNFTDIQIRSTTPRQAITRWIANGDVKLISTKATPDGSNYGADYAIRFLGVFATQVSLARLAP